MSDVLQVVRAKTSLGCFPMAVHATPARLVTDGDVVSQCIKANGFWEIRHPGDILASAGVDDVPRDGVMVDVGANLGFFTLLFALMGWSVFALEPMPLNRQLLMTSLCLNPSLKPKVNIVSAAVTSPVRQGMRCIITVHHQHQLAMSKHTANTGAAQLQCGKDAVCPQGHPLCDQVPTATLDSLAYRVQPLLDAGDRRVEFLKIDVEGAECDVLAGAREFVRQFAPTVVMVEAKRHAVRCSFAFFAEMAYIYVEPPGWRNHSSNPDNNLLFRRNLTIPARGRRR